MEREIKFRAFDRVGSPAIYNVEGIDFLYRKAWMVIDNVKKGLRIVSECLLMQSTGLKDKNGKEIYEGDIVSIVLDDDVHDHDEDCDKDCTIGDDAKRRTVVEWSKEWAGFVWNEDDLFGGEYIYSFNSYPYVYEVIGNIYENPELLK